MYIQACKLVVILEGSETRPKNLWLNVWSPITPIWDFLYRWAITTTYYSVDALRRPFDRFHWRFTQLEGFNSIMVIVDQLNKFAPFIFLKHSFTTTDVAHKLLQVIYLHRYFHVIISNRDQIFISQF